MFVTGGVNELKFRESLDIDDRLFKAMNNHNEILIKKYQEMAKEYMTHPFEWYDFNNRLMIYDAEKCKWRILGKHSAFSLVGSPGICRIGDDVYIINGEIKPGIRTSQNWKLNIRVEDFHN